MPECDCLIIGGGVIGLSLAYQLAGEGTRVTVIDRGEMGRQASWAGAGILPPASRVQALHPYEQLLAKSFELHGVWAEQLREETGIDYGYAQCGGLYLGRTPGEAASLVAHQLTLEEEQIPSQRLTAEEVAQLEPALADSCSAESLRLALHLPTEAQIRNPRYVKALIAACELRGVTLRTDCEAVDTQSDGERLTAINTTAGPLTAERFCFAAGAWTRLLLDQLGIETVIEPIRGQMILYRCQRPPVQRIVNEGHRYLVPRADGLLLAGSTKEEVGFEKQTTEEGLASIGTWAESLLPQLATTPIERTWAGLRPGTDDGFPYLGPLPQWNNAFLAAGHFRSGLYLSTGTAVEMAKLIRGEPTEIDLSPFSLLR